MGSKLEIQANQKVFPKLTSLTALSLQNLGGIQGEDKGESPRTGLSGS